MATVLITGASRGIGRASALRLAAAGWDVVAGVRDSASGRELTLHGITPIELDVTDPGQIAALDERLPERLDAVVNNAGVVVSGPVEALEIADLRRQLEVNVVGQVAVTQAVLPRLRATRGRVVFVSSVSGRFATPLSGAYNASKFAIEGLADSMRIELRPWGICVVLVEPGSTDTDVWRGMTTTIDETEARMRPVHRELYARHTTGGRKMVALVQKRTIPVEKVAATIERSLTGTRPRARYVAGLDGRAQILMRAMLPTRALDAVLARLSGWK